MKKSLFKRVLATVSSVPFALSQCLTYTSYAVTSDSVQSPVEQAESSSHSLNFYDTFLYIAEDDDDNHSNWDDNVYFALQSLGIKGTSGYIEKSVVADTILAHAGKYADKAQLAIDMIDDNGIKYEVTNTGDIVISGRLNDPDFSELALIKKANAGIVERFDEIEADIKRKYKENTDKLHEQYGVNVEEDLPDLENIDKEMLAQKYGIPASVLDSMPLTKEEISERYDVPLDLMEDVKSIEDINDEVLDIPKFDFSGIKFSGTYEIKIKASDLMTGDRTMSISASYTPDETGTPLSLGDAADFALKKVDEMHDSAEETLNKVASVKEAVEAADNARKTFNKQFNTLRKYINKVKNNQDRVTTINYGPVTADNFADLADKLNEKIENNKMVDKVENKLDKDIKIPSTAQAIVNNNIVKELFDVIIEQINIATAESGLSVNISLDVIAQFIDNDLYALMAQASSGTYELNGQFIDEKVPDSEYTRYLKATVDVGDIYSTNYNLATIGLDIWREPIVTTTTTTTTDDTTTTTTTSETTGTDETTETTTTSE
ncbi:MAG: hypothetical protein K2K02_04360, partial [Ruminococcus sp.]|nr:hypothetical protein [Ruminococcus sp.]